MKGPQNSISPVIFCITMPVHTVLQQMIMKLIDLPDVIYSPDLSFLH